MTPRNWGGKRRGAGRKPSPDRLCQLTVYLPEAQLAWLRQVGNPSAQVRALVDAAYQHWVAYGGDER